MNKKIIGKISLHRRGFGFVKPRDAHPLVNEVFIPRSETGGASPGDTVEVQYRRSAKGFEGKVVTIVKRARHELVGVLTDVWRTEALVHVPLLGQEALISVPLKQHKPCVGDRVALKVQEWGTAPEEILATISSILGNVDEAKTDIPYAVREQRIRQRFPASVMQELSAFPSVVQPRDRKGRLDLRDMDSITIDPATAKDFDDALCVTRVQSGGYMLSVHIADVSHYVQRGSTLDTEALKRSNSTYFPGKCIPMLPPALADRLCSLQPDVERLAVTVQMHFDNTGELRDYQIERSVIVSKQRFSYEEAKCILDGKRKSPFASMLHTMTELCYLLKKKRRERGSVEFALPEVVVEVNRQGLPTGQRLVAYDITHQLVEEFMLKTNEVVATHLQQSGIPLPYRIHEEPSAENLLAFRELARAFGFHLPATPTLVDLQRLFDQALATPCGEFLAVAYIRSMKQAAYSPDNVGHYGLSLERYCHFTSPIRRYADLIVHRMLFEDGYTSEELEEISTSASEQERISARAEETVLRFKKLRLLLQWHEKDPHRAYEAIVSRANSAGIAFELPSLMLGGFLSLSQLDNDYYRFNEKKGELRGRRSGRTFSSGTSIEVGLSFVDLLFGEAQWYLLA